MLDVAIVLDWESIYILLVCFDCSLLWTISVSIHFNAVITKKRMLQYEFDSIVIWLDHELAFCIFEIAYDCVITGMSILRHVLIQWFNVTSQQLEFKYIWIEDCSNFIWLKQKQLHNKRSINSYYSRSWPLNFLMEEKPGDWKRFNVSATRSIICRM